MSRDRVSVSELPRDGGRGRGREDEDPPRRSAREEEDTRRRPAEREETSDTPRRAARSEEDDRPPRREPEDDRPPRRSSVDEERPRRASAEDEKPAKRGDDDEDRGRKEYDDEPAPTDRSFDPDEVERRIVSERKKDPDYLKSKVTTGGGIVGSKKVPDDIYDAVILDFVQYKAVNKYKKDDEGRPLMKTNLRWIFEITGPDFEGEKVTGISTKSMNLKSKTYEWVSNMLGHGPDPDTDFDYRSLIGKAVRVSVEKSEKGFSNVVDILKPKGRKE